jgi:hypothetical protein
LDFNSSFEKERNFGKHLQEINLDHTCPDDPIEPVFKLFWECDIPLKKGCSGYGAAQGIEAEIPQARPRRAEELERIARSCRTGVRQDAPKFKIQS